MIDIKKTLAVLGIKASNNGTSTGAVSFGGGAEIESYSPVDGSLIGKVTVTTPEEYEKVMQAATAAFKDWRLKPAPLRGEIVRQYGEKLRAYKQELGELVSYEMGKSLQEGLGEVQEMIDICDFAVGLSRQLHGLTMHSERPGHRMYEQYHPLGVVGIISAFNFPVAVWNWNTALAWIAGDTCVWKASEKAPLCSIACQNIWNEVAKENDLPEGISCIVNGDYKVGEMMTSDDRLPLISATGSTRMGRIVGSEVAKRFGTSLLELGGNNAIIITPEADIEITIIGLKKIVVTWIISPCYSYIITESNKSMVTIWQSLTSNLYRGLLRTRTCISILNHKLFTSAFIDSSSVNILLLKNLIN